MLTSLNRIHVIFLLCLVIAGGMPAEVAQAGLSEAEKQEKQHQLEILRKRIDKLKQELTSRRSLYSEVVQQLQQIETQIGQRVKTLRRLKRRLQQQNRKLDKLRQEQRQLQTELDTQRELLGQQVKAAYVIGRQEYLKLLLNQESPAAVGRVATYYDYFNRARSQHIEESLVIIAKLETVEQQIQQQREKLQALHRQESNHKQTLEKDFRQRSQVLISLKQEIHSKDKHLAQLVEDEQQLQKLLRSLDRELNDILMGEGTRPNFAQQRGRLVWPARGEVRRLFGKSRNAGKLRWNGVLIDSREGNTVYAVARGRVAFADWLRGYGLLMIIDHGDGYMSLYGHNQGLIKEVGDWVEANEAIAVVGNSGGQDLTALYFEIRHNGKPTNPAYWCRRSRHG